MAYEYNYKEHKEPFLDQGYVYQQYRPHGHHVPIHTQPPAPSYSYGIPQTHPGQAVYYNAYPPGVTIAGTPQTHHESKDQMMPSMFVTFCCCFPIGIFAIMNAWKARDAIERGDYATAERYNKKARRLIKISMIVGAIFVVLMFIMFILTLIYYFQRLQHLR